MMAVMVRARCLTIIMKNSLNTLPIFPNHVTRQVFSSAYSTSGTQRFDSIVLQVSKFHYTSISIPLLWKVLLKMQRCYVTLKYKIYLPVRPQTGNKSIHAEGKIREPQL